MTKIVKPVRVLQTKHRKKWVNSLRSGKFKQGRGRLHELDDNGGDLFCCLGVAACVIGGLPVKKLAYNYTLNDISTTDNYGITAPLQTALAYANDGGTKIGIKNSFTGTGFKTTPRLYKQRSGMYKATFKSIANWIDKNL